MENLIVAQQVVAKANFATVESLSGLAVGDLIAIGDGRKIIGSDAVAADLADVKEVQFITKLTSTGKLRISVPIPRTAITSINTQTATASQAQIQRIGGITSTLAINIDSEGEAIVRVENLSYNHTIKTQRVSVSSTKKASQTELAFMTAFVAKLNASASAQAVPFFTAALVADGGNNYFGITFTTLGDNVDMAVLVDGMFSSNTPVITQVQKVAIGKGSDVVAMEKDMQRHLGNNNYAELTDLWYNQPVDSASGIDYDICTLNWSGVARTATTARHVANNTLAIAVQTGTNIGDITALLNVIFSNTYTVDAGAEVADSTDEDAIDNVIS